MELKQEQVPRKRNEDQEKTTRFFTKTEYPVEVMEYKVGVRFQKVQQNTQAENGTEGGKKKKI